MEGGSEINDIIVWVADIGSVRQDHFGWCRAISQTQSVNGKDISVFVQSIVNDLSNGSKIALGFECPLFVPVASDPQGLTSARQGETNRAWSAGAGSGSLATGLTICAWIFEKIHCLAQVSVQPTVEWASFVSTEANLFIWEAFVSGTAKAVSHHGDAEIAARTFWAKYPNIVKANAITTQNPYSLVGAALLRAGLTRDLSILSKPCIVIKS
jgi:hypothetical protein